MEETLAIMNQVEININAVERMAVAVRRIMMGTVGKRRMEPIARKRKSL